MDDPDPPQPIPIPPHWSPAQAAAVFELLTQLADAVFRAYKGPLTTIAYRDAMGLPLYHPVEHDDDLIPF